MEAKEKWNGRLYNHDGKPISYVFAVKPILKLPPKLTISKIKRITHENLEGLPRFLVYPNDQEDVTEWKTFLTHLYKHNRIAYIPMEGGVEAFLLPPPAKPGHFDAAPLVVRGPIDGTTMNKPRAAQMHPEYLVTLSQTHASWMFGALAELIDNARDAGSTRLDISVTKGMLRGSTEEIPMLRFQDDGTGMSHKEILQMVSFGHKRPEDDPDMIGRFGVGFKTGAMRLGKDAVVFTQKDRTRSIALLSTSYNSEKDVLEVPVITYLTQSPSRMEPDPEAQSKEVAKANEKAITEFSPFDKYGIGSEFSRFNGKTGTLIYVYNLEKRGSDYSLNWTSNDITIRSKRVRTRPGQTSQQVPLDYSLRAYLEVMFLKPRTIVYVQGKMVKTKLLAQTLHKTKVIKGVVCGKPVQLTLGRNKAEVNRGNCGIFLYWHGRLIEAYKRVGNMIHSADWGRGVIGVVETTVLMEFAKGKVGVLNNKQGFEDSEEYAILEKWLGEQVNSYWEQHDECLHKEDYDGFPPDHDWVQCNKCLKWRVLPDGVNSETLPDEWFCYMAPYQGKCDDPEEKPEPGVVTVSTRRGTGVTGTKPAEKAKPALRAVKPDPDRPVLKRLKRGAP